MLGSGPDSENTAVNSLLVVTHPFKAYKHSCKSKTASVMGVPAVGLWDYGDVSLGDSAQSEEAFLRKSAEF